MRNIDADSLMQRVVEIQASPKSPEARVGEIIIAISEAPIVDAVEVVRCRECKYSYGNKYCTNDAWKDEGNTVYIEPDAFCSYGERRGKDG